MRKLTSEDYERGCLASIRRNGYARLTPLSGQHAWDAAWRLTRLGYLDAHEESPGTVVFRLSDQLPTVGTSRAS